MPRAGTTRPIDLIAVRLEKANPTNSVLRKERSRAFVDRDVKYTTTPDCSGQVKPRHKISLIGTFRHDRCQAQITTDPAHALQFYSRRVVKKYGRLQRIAGWAFTFQVLTRRSGSRWWLNLPELIGPSKQPMIR